MQAQAAVQRAANVQLEKAATLQRDTYAKKDAATLDRDKKALEAASKSSQDLTVRRSAQVGPGFCHHGSGPHHWH